MVASFVYHVKYVNLKLPIFSKLILEIHTSNWRDGTYDERALKYKWNIYIQENL